MTRQAKTALPASEDAALRRLCSHTVPQHGGCSDSGSDRRSRSRCRLPLRHWVGDRASCRRGYRGSLACRRPSSGWWRRRPHRLSCPRLLGRPSSATLAPARRTLPRAADSTEVPERPSMVPSMRGRAIVLIVMGMAVVLVFVAFYVAVWVNIFLGFLILLGTVVAGAIVLRRYARGR